MASMNLVFEKGPRNGEFRTYNPRSKVRIGRIVKGNNLTIKDDAISSQHFTIHFDSGLGKWVITDLNSSNGTRLNSTKLKPLTPFELGNGDDIKIGDSTSIRVEIVDVAKKPPEVDEGYPNLVEGDSVRVYGVENLKKGVDSGVNLGIENRKGRGRGRAKKEIDGTLILDVEKDAKPKQEQKMATRSTRNTKRAADEFLCLEKIMPVSRTRGGRGKKNKAELENSENVKDNTTTMDVSQLEEPIGDTIQQYPLVDEVIEEASQLKVVDEESMGYTIQETPLVDTLNKEQKCEEPFMGGENDNGALERLENDLVMEGGEVERTEVEEMDEDEELDTGIDEEENEHKFETLPDLEKMTLGDLFDYLKVSLRMQICAARDQTIRDMRKSAKQFDEFRLQQQEEEGK